MVKPRLYFAAPLFSKAEKDFNEDLAGKLSPYFDIFLPQRDGDLLVNLLKSGMSKESASKRIFDNDLRHVKDSDYMLVVLDGRGVDEGTSFELGYATPLEKHCVGLKTDPRTIDPRIEGALKTVFSSIDDLLEWAKTAR